ncbi:putative ubiquitin binding protein [Acetobacter sp. CAG:977]|nr:putative ubiquitin binding protein [Acetobacter sp. CAG:977]
MISELLQAIALAMVIEGLYYALMPDKAQEAMRRLCSVPASVLSTAGMILALFGTVCVILLRR